MKHNQALVYILALGVGICALFMFAGPALGQPCEQWAAKIVSVQGAVQVRKAGETSWIQVRLNQTYCPGDIIRVLKNSRAAISLSNDSLIRVDQNTTITFTGIEKEKTFFIDLIRGVAHFFSRFPRRLKVATPFVNAAVEGTEFYMRVEDDQTFISIFEGRVAATNAAGSLILAGGQTAVAEAGKAPVLQVLVKPRDAVQWALYYPPIIDWRLIDFAGGEETDWQGMARKSIKYYWQGDMTGAFSVLERAPEKIRDPRFYLYRAALFLTVGRIGAAQTDITKALSIDPSNSYAVALQSIIAVVQNENDRALELASRAVKLAPKSSTAMVALSYAQQAHFNIQGALNSLKKAVELGPENALAWSRFAELYLSVGELTKSAKAANRAVALNPGIARTQTVLGFTLIDRVKIKAAKETFNKAIQLDSAAPLPRLGLGLAKIRGGNLKEGRAEIEIAASLDPNNSLIRSYLGKAYYEEKRDKLAEDQYSVAKKLDPLDPTAWFYDAIRKQTINRPVEALHDMRRAIKLNDNRGVYRSRLLLDQDLAARSAALGRIYNDLGFQQIGLLEGWNSLNTDPTNYSAHRLLADSYSALPRHEIARVSELLQSQLLQPLNVTPVQPQLSQTNLLILEGAGPAEPSFNEFNPLFLRNRFALQASMVGGGKNTVGNELVHSAVWDKYSYSLGQFHFQTDGFRENNDQDQDILNAYAQVSLSPKVSMQAEYRHRDLKHGDLSYNFDLDNFNESFDKNIRTDTFRAGVHYAPMPHSDFIASVIYQDEMEKQSFVTSSDTGLGFTIDSSVNPKLNSDGYIAEGQYIFRQPLFSLIAGGGHYNADNSLKIKIENIFGSSVNKVNWDTKHSNGYLYSHIHYPSKMTWTFGASYDSFDDGVIGDTQRLNPKLGITFDLAADTTLRFAFFKVIKRTLFADQTLEPTQVAGFNQFFDDINGTRATRYGAAIDHAFSTNFFAGLNYSIRRLRVPIAGDNVLRESWDEDLLRAYLYWTIYRNLALSVEYQYEDFDRNARIESTEPPTSMNTHLLPATLGYFHPSGLFGRLRTTYVNQKVKLSGEGNKDDAFTLADIAVGYRLPERYGIFSIGVRNIFDRDFDFQGIEPRTSREDASNPPFSPERTVVFQLTLSF